MSIHRLLTAALALAAANALAACDEFPGTPAPGSCAAGEKICYFEPTQDRLVVLRCNAGEVQGAIWLIDDVCDDGQTCEAATCSDPNPAP